MGSLWLPPHMSDTHNLTQIDKALWRSDKPEVLPLNHKFQKHPPPMSSLFVKVLFSLPSITNFRLLYKHSSTSPPWLSSREVISVTLKILSDRDDPSNSMLIIHRHLGYFRWANVNYSSTLWIFPVLKSQEPLKILSGRDDPSNSMLNIHRHLEYFQWAYVSYSSTFEYFLWAKNPWKYWRVVTIRQISC